MHQDRLYNYIVFFSFETYFDLVIVSEGLQNSAFDSALTAFELDTLYDTGPQFSWSRPKDDLVNRLFRQARGI